MVVLLVVLLVVEEEDLFPSCKEVGHLKEEGEEEEWRGMITSVSIVQMATMHSAHYSAPTVHGLFAALAVSII